MQANTERSSETISGYNRGYRMARNRSYSIRKIASMVAAADHHIGIISGHMLVSIKASLLLAAKKDANVVDSSNTANEEDGLVE